MEHTDSTKPLCLVHTGRDAKKYGSTTKKYNIFGVEIFDVEQYMKDNNINPDKIFKVNRAIYNQGSK